jgi:ATP-GRASP peptide maturase of grasp-with-spasm system
MVLIVSTDNDVSTNLVVTRIIQNRCDFLRINYGDAVEIEDLAVGGEKFNFSVNGIKYSIEQFSSYWYRRGIFVNAQMIRGNTAVAKQVNHFIENENLRLNEYIESVCLKRKRHLGDFRRRQLNKLAVLDKAAETGLDIPYGFVTSVSEQIHKIIPGKRLITKPVSEVIQVQKDGDYRFKMYTQEFEPSMYSDIGSCGPSFFQERIEKEFEIRIVYLLGKFYAMAIFSQINNNTIEDFRGASENIVTNRFDLPEAIEKKLDRLIRHIGLNFCSIDMIYGADKRYYFLEINPCGQFGMVSIPCFYEIEKKVADYLCFK